MRTFSYVILVIVALVIAGICLLFPNEVAELIDQTIESENNAGKVNVDSMGEMPPSPLPKMQVEAVVVATATHSLLQPLDLARNGHVLELYLHLAELLQNLERLGRLLGVNADHGEPHVDKTQSHHVHFHGVIVIDDAYEIDLAANAQQAQARLRLPTR